MVEWFQLLLFNVDNSIKYKSFAYRQLSGYLYCYLTLFYSTLFIDLYS